MSIGCGINVTLLIWLIDAIAVSLPRPAVCQHTRRLAGRRTGTSMSAHLLCAPEYDRNVAVAVAVAVVVR